MTVAVAVTNAKTFSRQSATAIARLEAFVDRVFRGYAVTAFQRVVDDTPQWTGQAAASWNFSVGSPELEVDRDMRFGYDALVEFDGNRGPLYRAHERPAINRAMERNRGREKDVDSSSKVFISNAASTLSGVEYAKQLEDNPAGYLRPENEGGGMVAKTIDSMKAHFARITPAMARSLAGEKIA